MIATMDLKRITIFVKRIKLIVFLFYAPPIPQFRQSINDVFRHVHNIHLRTPHMPDNNRMEKVYILCIGLNILMGRIIKLICFV